MKKALALSLALALPCASRSPVLGGEAFIRDIFSTVSFPAGDIRAAEGWREKVYNARDSWEVLAGPDGPVLHAVSDGTASMLYRKITYDAKTYPLLRWRWKVMELPRKGKETTRGNDDYGARVYVLFPGWTFLGSRALQYVWDNDTPAGTIKTSPSSGRCKQLVVNAGSTELGQWVTVERNLLQDYATAFGREPDRPVGAIGFMTDSDNTSSRAEAFYGPVTIGR